MTSDAQSHKKLLIKIKSTLKYEYFREYYIYNINMFTLRNFIKNPASFKQGASFLSSSLKPSSNPAFILNTYASCFSTATHQHQQLVQTYSAGLQASRYCKFDESMPHFQQIISAITANPGQLSREDSLLLVQAYHQLGEALKKKERFVDSLKEYMKGLKLVKANNLEKTKEAGLLYHSIAELSIEESQFDEARACLEKAKDVFSGLGEESYLMENEYLMGLLCEKSNKTAKAIEIWENILKSNENIGKEFNIAQLYLRLGRSYLKEGKQMKATEYFEKSIEITVQQFGEESIELLPVYSKLTDILSEYKIYNEAVVYAERSVKIAEKYLKANDSDLGRYYTILGELHLCRTKDYAKALATSQKALEIYLNHPTENKEEIADLYLQVAQTFANMGDRDQAERIASKGDIFASENFPTKHPIHFTYYAFRRREIYGG